MFSVSAPATPVDLDEKLRAKSAPNMSGLKTGKAKDLWSPPPLYTEPPLGLSNTKSDETSLEAVEPAALAAKILQLSSNKLDMRPVPRRQPKLNEPSDDETFYIPSVFQQPDEETYESVPVRPEALDAGERKAKLGSGPSFKFLVVSTLALGLAGGAVLTTDLGSFLKSEAENSDLSAEEALSGAAAAFAAAKAALAKAAQPADPTQSGPAVHFAQSAATTQTAQAAQAEEAAPSPASPRGARKAEDRIKSAFEAENAAQTQSGTTPAFPLPVQPAQPAGSSNSRSQEPSSHTADVLRDIAASPAFADRSSLDDATSAPVPAQAAPSTPVRSQSAPAAAAPAQTPANADPAYPNAGRTLEAVNMRLTGNQDGEIIAVIPKDTILHYSDCGTWWCGVRYNDKIGFVGQKYIEKAEPQVASE